MTLSPADMDRLLDQHFAYEAADDIDGVVGTLASDVEHDVVGWPLGPSRGPSEARAFYEATFADLADGKVRSLRRLYGDKFIVDDAIWSGTAVGTPFGIAGNGRPLEFRLLHVLEFADDGAIRRENVWIDLAAIQQQLAE